MTLLKLKSSNSHDDFVIVGGEENSSMRHAPPPRQVASVRNATIFKPVQEA